MAGPHARTIEVGGATVALHVLGTGPPLLLLHGSGPGTTAWAAWEPLCEALAGRFSLVAPDQAGFGATPVPAGRDARRSLWTEQALAVMDALGHERYAVAGHSMGGAVALSLAAARPHAVRSVVGIGSMGAAMALPEGLDRLWAARPSRDGAREVLGLIAADPVPDAAVDARREAMRAQGGEAYAALFPPPRERWVADLALGEDERDAVTALVLLVHGARDRIVPLRDGALPLVEQLGNAHLYVLGDCGHSPHAQRPEIVHRLIGDFLEIDA